MTKKFYQLATIHQTDDAYEIHLDGKILKTPKGHVFLLPNETLAHLVAEEWNGVIDTIDPTRMPITQICMTARDFYTEKFADWQRDILAYLDSDALCFWADKSDVIYERQQNLIAPMIDALQSHISLTINITDKLELISQDPEWKIYLEKFLGALPPIAFTDFYLTTTECGSVFLALALYHGLVTPENAYSVVYLEDQYKSEIYNEALYGIAPDLERKQISTQNFLNAAQKVFQSLSMTA